MPDLTELRSLPLFAALPDDLLNKVLLSLLTKSYPARKSLLQQDQTPNFLIIVNTGQVQGSILSEEGRVVAVFFYGKGSVIGLEALIDGLPLGKALTTSRTTELWLLPVAVARSLLNVPSFSLETNRIIVRMIRQLNEGQRLLGLPNAFQRIFTLIHHLSDKDNHSSNPIQLPKQQDVAVMVNTSRETVSRALHRLIKLGILIKSGSQIFLVDPKRLRQLTSEGANRRND